MVGASNGAKIAQNVINESRLNEIKVVGLDRLIRTILAYEKEFKALSDVAFFSIIDHLHPDELVGQELHK